MVGVQSKFGLKPVFSTAVSVKAYDENQAKQKAVGKIIENNLIFKRRRSLNFWTFSITNLTEMGAKNGN